MGFALAKRNFDVWLGNFRGNTYSKKHTTYSTKNPQFWKFTFDNYALQDLPAMIGYIQKVTNYDQIGFVGYSIGKQIFQIIKNLFLELKTIFFNLRNTNDV